MISGADASGELDDGHDLAFVVLGREFRKVGLEQWTPKIRQRGFVFVSVANRVEQFRIDAHGVAGVHEFNKEHNVLRRRTRWHNCRHLCWSL